MSKRPPSEPVCPICGEPRGPRPENPYAPFCSKRCKMVDLSRWMNGDYVISTPLFPRSGGGGDGER